MKQLKLSLDQQKRTGRKLGGYLSKVAMSLTRAFRKLLPGSYVYPLSISKDLPSQPDLIRLLPEAPARRLRALVLDQMADDGRAGAAD